MNCELWSLHLHVHFHGPGRCPKNVLFTRSQANCSQVHRCMQRMKLPWCYFLGKWVDMCGPRLKKFTLLTVSLAIIHSRQKYQTIVCSWDQFQGASHRKIKHGKNEVANIVGKCFPSPKIALSFLCSIIESLLNFEVKAISERIFWVFFQLNYISASYQFPA